MFEHRFRADKLIFGLQDSCGIKLDSSQVSRPHARPVLSISRRLAESGNLDTHLPIIIDSLFEIFPKADRGSVVLQDPESGQFKLHISGDRRSAEVAEPHVSATVLGRVFSEKVGILSADTYTDSRFDTSKSI